MHSAEISRTGSHMEKLWSTMFIYFSLTHHSIIGNTVLFMALSMTRVTPCEVCTQSMQGAKNRTQLGPVPLSLLALKAPHTHLELLNLISVVLFLLRCALKWWASWLLPAPPIHNKGQPDEERGCQSPISVPLITTDLSSVTALIWLSTVSIKH